MNTSASTWIVKYLKRFCRRVDPPDWPDLGTEEYDDLREDWTEALDRHRVTEADADAALRRLRENPPQWGREHLPKLLEAITALRRERSVGPETSSRDDAERESRDCEHCNGSGFAVVFHPQFTGSGVIEITNDQGHVRQIAAQVSAHCVCAMGRWLRFRTDDDIRRRIPDLQAVLDGRLRWLIIDPTLAAYVGWEPSEKAAVAGAA